MTERYCENCIWYDSGRMSLIGFGVEVCRHKKAKTHNVEDLVHRPSEYQVKCKTMRLSDLPCGPDAKLYEPRKHLR